MNDNLSLKDSLFFEAFIVHLMPLIWPFDCVMIFIYSQYFYCINHITSLSLMFIPFKSHKIQSNMVIMSTNTGIQMDSVANTA